MPIFNAALRGTRHSKAMWPSTPTVRSSPPPSVTPGNAGDASAAAGLIDDLLGDGDGNGTDDDDGPKPKVYGDNAYGTGEFQSKLEGAGIASGCKSQAPTRRVGCSPRTAWV